MTSCLMKIHLFVLPPVRVHIMLKHTSEIFLLKKIYFYSMFVPYVDLIKEFMGFRIIGECSVQVRLEGILAKI